ncbi:MAG: glycosyltransferase family 39 protein [Asticcacaulis sp.]|nr:glycosyltransferase family 39 protein [Asticcacaulis sp.]
MDGDFVAWDAPRPVLGARGRLVGEHKALLRAALVLLAVMTAWKLYIACTYHVLWDEAHFAVSGAHPDLAYPDIPPAYPWLARGVTAIFGWRVLPLRVVALVFATAIPFAVHFMAEPVVGKRNALWAAILSLAVPAVAMNGTIFYPESALQLLLAVMCGCLVRAVASQGLKWWILAGCAAALGMLVHYRFIIPGLGVLVFLGADPLGRTQWRTKGLYICAAIAVTGLVPSLIYNAVNGWPAIQFHILNRPQYAFSLNYFVGFAATQIFMAGFVFFAAMAVGARNSMVTARGTPSALVAYVGVVTFAFYLLQALVNKKIMPHWPWLAFVPLLAFLPGVLITYVDQAANRRDRGFRSALVALGPIVTLGAAAGFSIIAYAQAHGMPLPQGLSTVTNSKSEDWSLLVPDVEHAAAVVRARSGKDPVWVTNGHAQAVHLEFPGQPGSKVYTLDSPDDIATRFVVARHRWGLDRTALVRDHSGEDVVLVLQAPEFLYHEAEHVAFYKQVCTLFSDVRRDRTTILPPGQMRFDIYSARVRAAPDAPTTSQPCPLLPQVYIGRPALGDRLDVDDKGHFFGMAADPHGVTKVDILLDGKVVAHARYGLDPQGARAPDVLKYDPGYPNVQYDFDFAKGTLTAGRHTLTVVATRKDGATISSEPQPLVVQ